MKKLCVKAWEFVRELSRRALGKRPSAKVIAVKAAINNGSYDWDKAVRSSAEKILENPESLLWR